VQEEITPKSSDLVPAPPPPDSVADANVRQAISVPKHESSKAAEIAPKAASPTQDEVYVQAEPQTGYATLYDYFAANLKYPSDALADSIQGVQTISFIINTNGTPEKIMITNSLGDSFDKEARRLIETMPAWNPATLNGRPVASKVSLPLTFQIQKIKN
jgi:protein TonB